MKVDLHIHTSCSDGCIDLRKDVETLLEDYDLVAITDHENLFLPDAYSLSDSDTRFISGVEISCNFKGKRIEILGYNFDACNVGLRNVVSEVKEKRISALHEVLLQNKIDQFKIEGNPFRMNVRLPQHIDRKAFWKENEELYKSIYHSVNAETVINAICNAGGIPVLAHPMESLYGCSEEKVETLILSLGVRYIELLTPKHTTGDVIMLERIIKRHGLSASIGSDTHKSVMREIPFEYDLGQKWFSWINQLYVNA